MASLNELHSLLHSHVLEVKFIRRSPKPGSPLTRRALITNCNALLNSPNGKVILRYVPAGSGLKFNPTLKGLILTWDLMWQSFRLFGAEGSSIITKIPVSSEEEVNSFWDYFNKSIMPMSPEAKLSFMNS